MTAREAFERGRNRWGVLLLRGAGTDDWDALYLTQTANGELVVNNCLLISDDVEIDRLTDLWSTPRPATARTPGGARFSSDETNTHHTS